MSKDTSYNVASQYLASDQWLQACVAEEFTYDEYRESAKNNNKVLATIEQFNDEVLSNKSVIEALIAECNSN